MEKETMLWIVKQGGVRPVKVSAKEGKDLGDGERYFSLGKVVKPGCDLVLAQVGQLGDNCWEHEYEAWAYLLRHARTNLSLMMARVAEIEAAIAEAGASG